MTQHHVSEIGARSNPGRTCDSEIPWTNDGPPAATVGLPVLASKLRAPLWSENNIRREQIEQSIRGAPAAKLIFVCGPAGFGKTTTMLQYYEQLRSADSAVAWLNFDDEDNDFERFLAHVRMIFDRVAGAAEQPASPEATELIYRIARVDRPLALFMDECESINSPSVLDFLRRMIQHLPAGGRLVIGSRSVPSLGVGRLRVRHQLLEIGPGQLRFSLAETAELFRSRRHPLSDEEVRRLHDQTEGWPAALHLASLSLSSSGDHQRLIANFSGSHASVADYLEEDVLAKLSDELNDFLMCTCVLSDLCAPLCTAVSGNPRSGELLAQLECASLFLMPQDPERRWFRYHALFADFLRSRLKRCHPELLPGLHRAASRWYAAQDRPILAIEHALESKETDQAVALIEEHAESLLRRHRSALLARWYGALPLSAFDSRPRLRIAFAWALAFARRRSEAIHLIEGLSHSTNDSLADSSIHLSCAAVRVVSLIMADELVACGEACDEALPALRGKTSFAGAVVALFRAVCLITADKFDEAGLMIAEVQRHCGGQHGLSCDSRCVKAVDLLSVLDLSQGRLRDAQERMRRAVADWSSDPDRELVCGARLNVFLAGLLYQSDELFEAERLLTEYLPLACERGLPDIFITGYVTLARIAYAQQDRARALKILADLAHLGHQEELPRLVLNHWLERSRIALLEGDIAAAKACWVCATEKEAWKPFRSIVPRANDVDAPEVAHLRLLVRSGCCEEALPDIKRQLREAHDRNRHHRGLKLKILLAEALHGCGQAKPAMRVLHEAMQCASQQGFVRTFAEEGSTVAQLLLALRQTTLSDADVSIGATVPAEFIDRVLRACGHSTAGMAVSTDPTPPTPRQRVTRSEQRVLNLLAHGLSNESIAAKLFVAPSTVNAHLRNINAKFGVHNRMQAVAVAQRQGLITNSNGVALAATEACIVRTD